MGALKKQEASGYGQSAMGEGRSALVRLGCCCWYSACAVAAAVTAHAAAWRLVISIMLMLTLLTLVPLRTLLTLLAIFTYLLTLPYRYQNSRLIPCGSPTETRGEQRWAVGDRRMVIGIGQAWLLLLVLRLCCCCFCYCSCCCLVSGDPHYPCAYLIYLLTLHDRFPILQV